MSSILKSLKEYDEQKHEAFHNIEKEITKRIWQFTTVGFIIGYVMGMGTAFFIALTILKWHK